MMNEKIVNKTITSSINFIKKINPKKKVVIVYGHDNDTICSAVVIYKLLKKIYKINSSFFVTEDNFAVNEKDIDGIKKKNPDYIIIVDIAHLSSKKVESFLSKKKTLIIDHHQPLKLKKITYSNPRDFDKMIYMPVSYITYKIYEKLGNIKDVAWIAAVGVLSDHGISNSKDLFDYIKKNHKDLLDTFDKTKIKIVEEKLFNNSKIGLISIIFNSARVIAGKKGASKVLKILIKSDFPDYVLKIKNKDTKNLLLWYSKVEKEFHRCVKDFKENKKIIKKKIIYYEINSKISIKSSLSGYLTQFYKKNIIIFSQKSGKYFSISFRRGKNNKTNLNKLAKKSIKGIPNANAGGHEAASGGKIPSKYLSKFLNQL